MVMPPRISPTTYEVAFVQQSSNAVCAELIFDLLLNKGIESEKIVETTENDLIMVSVYFPSLQKAKSFVSEFKKLQLKNVAIRLSSLNKKQWLTKWKEDFKPFSLTRSFGVVPAWMKEEYSFKRKQNVLIDTHLAFGTGLHPTTQYVSQFIENCRGKFDSFCDIGLGTGVLSIIASFSGAKEIVGIDISPDCVKCSKRNFSLNDLLPGNFIAADIATWTPKKKFDFVAANLITHDLIKYKRKLLVLIKPQKYLAVSGISLHNYKMFRESFKNLPLKCLKIEKKQGWAALLFKKT